MTMRRVAGCLLLLGACATTAPGPRDGPALSGGYHGVVVWLDPDGHHDTVRVSFPTDWRRTEGTDTAWTFRADDGRQLTFGRRVGNMLFWGHGRVRSYLGTLVEFSGPIDPDGRVRGCSVPPRILPRYRTTFPVAAFALAPRNAPAPTAGDAPVSRCGRG